MPRRRSTRRPNRAARIEAVLVLLAAAVLFVVCGAYLLHG